MDQGEAREIAAYYDRLAEGYLAGTRRTLHYEGPVRRWVAGEVARVASGGRDARVLDVGCGPGQLTAQLPPGARVVGCDLSPAMLALARAARPEGHYFVHDFHAPYPALEPVDVAIAVGCFEFCRDLTAALGHLGRVVRPGGRLLASVVDRRPELDGHGASPVVLARRRGREVRMHLYGAAEVLQAAGATGWAPTAYQLERGWSDNGHTWHYGLWELARPEAGPAFSATSRFPGG